MDNRTAWIRARIVAISTLVLFSDGSVARSAPLLGGRTGGLALVGPATPHPASMVDNPAALALLGGGHMLVSTTAALQRSTVDRRNIDNQTGEPLPGAGSSGSDASDLTSETYVGATTALGTDYLVLGLAAYNTWDSVSYLRGESGDFFAGAPQDSATRYHGTSLLFAHLFTTLATSVRVTSNIHLGLSFSYVHSWVDYRFVRDVALSGGSTLDDGEDAALDAPPCGADPCGYENDGAAEAIHVDGESDGLAFGAGVLWRVHRDVDIGLGYRSAMVSFGGERIAAADDAWVQRAEVSQELAAEASSGNATQGDGRRDPATHPTGRGKIIYRLPHAVNAGATWRASRRVALDLQLKWLGFRLHDVLDVRLTGAEFQTRPRVPDRIVHYRGFQDVFAAQVGAQWHILPQLHLQGAVMLASSAVNRSALTGASIDNWNIDALLALRWRVAWDLSLGLGYGIVWVPEVELESSDFHPSSFVHCVDGSFDVELAECGEASQGRGLASTVGSYSRIVHRLGLSVSYAWR